MSYVFFVILLCSIVPPGHFGVIQATTGEALVDEVIGNIKSSLDVREDHSLLKRIALVESRFGEDNDVIDANPEGGIWQITSDIHDVLNSTAEDKASSLLTSIENSFEFLCFLCSFNYSTPLRSGLAAQLFIEITNKFYISKTMCGQSKWWSENYHTSLDSSVFVERVTTYNVIPVEVNLDLMFLFDVSENVDQEKFERSKDFTCTLAAQFSISKTKTSCGAVEFAKSSQNSCPFKKTNDLNDFQSVLVNRTKPKVVKESGKAIEEILDRGYLTEVKPRSDGISARKCVVMMRCDGKETDDLAAPIDKMHAENVTVLTLGIGDDIEKEEIQFVNPGDNMYFPNFSDLLQEDNQKQIITEGITKAFCRHENPYTPGEMIVICITLCVVSVNEAEGEDRKAYYRLGSEIEFEIKCDWCTGFNVTKGGEVVGTENYTNSISARDFEIMVKLESFRNQLETDFNNGVPLSSSAASTCIDEPKGDVWFMLDGSGNITDEQFQATLDFVSAMASKLNVSNSTVRAGLSVASSDNHVIYNTFNDSSDLDTFQQLVTSAEKPPITRNVGEALQNTLNESYSEEAGARSVENGTQRGIVLFVDGDSSDSVTEIMEELQQDNISLVVVDINDEENALTVLENAMTQLQYGHSYDLEETFQLTVVEEIVKEVKDPTILPVVGEKTTTTSTTTTESAQTDEEDDTNASNTATAAQITGNAAASSDDDNGIEGAGNENENSAASSDDDNGIEGAGNENENSAASSDDDNGIEGAGNENENSAASSDDDNGIEGAGSGSEPIQVDNDVPTDVMEVSMSIALEINTVEANPGNVGVSENAQSQNGANGNQDSSDSDGTNDSDGSSQLDETQNPSVENGIITLTTKNTSPSNTENVEEKAGPPDNSGDNGGDIGLLPGNESSPQAQQANTSTWLIPIVAALLLATGLFLFFLYKRKKKKRKVEQVPNEAGITDGESEASQSVKETLVAGFQVNDRVRVMAVPEEMSLPSSSKLNTDDSYVPGERSPSLSLELQQQEGEGDAGATEEKDKSNILNDIGSSSRIVIPDINVSSVDDDASPVAQETSAAPTDVPDAAEDAGKDADTEMVAEEEGGTAEGDDKNETDAAEKVESAAAAPPPDSDEVAATNEETSGVEKSAEEAETSSDIGGQNEAEEGPGNGTEDQQD